MKTSEIKKVLGLVAGVSGAKIDFQPGETLQADITTPLGVEVKASVVQEEPIRYPLEWLPKMEKAIGSKANPPEQVEFLELRSDLVHETAIHKEKLGSLCVGLLERAYPLTAAIDTQRILHVRRDIELTSSFNGKDVISPELLGKSVITALEMFDEQVPKLKGGIERNFLK